LALGRLRRDGGRSVGYPSYNMGAFVRFAALFVLSAGAGCTVLLGLEDTPTITDGAVDASGTDADAVEPQNGDADSSIPPGADAAASEAYRALIMGDAPIGYWRFDETTGVQGRDETEGGRPAQYQGGFTLGVDGASGGSRAVRVDCSQLGRISLGTNFLFEGNAPFSIEVWFRPEGIDARYRRIFSTERAGSPRNGYTAWLRSLRLGTERFSDGSGTSAHFNEDIAQGCYHHLVVTYDGAVTLLYLDGESVAASEAPQVMAMGNGPFYWGYSAYAGPDCFVGSLDEAAIYDKPLAPVRVKEHHRALAGQPDVCPSLAK
jgi:hypothetical protein